MATHRAKEGYVRVCTDIKKETNDVFIALEEKTNLKVNKSKLMSKVLDDEA